MEFITYLLYGITFIITAIILGSPFFWSFELERLTNFKVQYIWLLMLLGVMILTCWWYGKINFWAVFLILCILSLSLVDLLPWYFSRQQVVIDRSNVLRVMSFNICALNLEIGSIATSIRSTNPDLVLLVEVTPRMMIDLKVELENDFSYSFRSPGGGLGVLSKLSLKEPMGIKFPGSNATNLITTIEYQHRLIKIIGTHPFAPRRASLFEYRNLQLESIGNYLKDSQTSTILLGDFNLTPWSPYYQRLVKTANLHNTRMGFGILPTWLRGTDYVEFPSWSFPILNIPIDHILITKDIKVLRTYTGDPGNSDHAPLISELAID